MPVCYHYQEPVLTLHRSVDIGAPYESFAKLITKTGLVRVILYYPNLLTL
jgi:hypothetical protein